MTWMSFLCFFIRSESHTKWLGGWVVCDRVPAPLAQGSSMKSILCFELFSVVSIN